jgi:hypothetical protein
VIVLLDENFPLGLLRVLQSDGVSAEHIIPLGWRGTSDARIRERLQNNELLFLTQDEDFLFGEPVAAIIVVSRVKQSRSLKDRIGIWQHCVRELLEAPTPNRLWELLDDGTLLPWRDRATGG